VSTGGFEFIQSANDLKDELFAAAHQVVGGVLKKA